MSDYGVRVPLVRPRVNAANVNAAGLTDVECVGVDRDGCVWFADTLPADDELAVRDWLSTRDDADLERRLSLRAVPASTEAGVLVNGFEILRAHLLGDPLPEPVYPSPANDPQPDPLTATVTDIAARLA